MEKLSQSLVSKITKMQRRMEAILENDFDKKLDETEVALNFEPSMDLQLIKGLSLGLPEDHIDKAIVTFSRLALLFDSGVLLENQDGKWKPQAYFEKGLSHLLKADNRPLVSLPTMNMFDVLKTNAAPLLEKFQLQNFSNIDRLTSLLIKVSPDYCYVLNSALPEIWLKDHIENIRKALLNGMVE